MNAIAKVEPRRSVIATLADSYGMEAAAFEATLRGTVFPASGTREEFAAFALIAKEYKLNPLLREIYAFPKKGGGIVPIVGIDGWLNLINTHAQYDGMEFDYHDDAKGALVAVTCKIYRKDRKHPTIVTEYLDECIRPTDPWKMKRRMLRHKAAMQCARYAFGFSGIYDEDEAHDIATTRDVSPPPPPPVLDAIDPPAPPAKAEVEDAVIVSEAASAGPSPAEAQAADAPPGPPPVEGASAADPEEPGINPDDEIGNLIDKLAHAKDEATVEEWYVETDIEAALEGFEGYVKKAQDVRDLHLQRVRKMAAAELQAEAAAAPPPPPPAGGLDDDAAAPPAAGPDLSTVEKYQAHLQAQLDAAQVSEDFAKIRAWWSDTRGVRNDLDMSQEKRVELQGLFDARKKALGL